LARLKTFLPEGTVEDFFSTASEIVSVFSHSRGVFSAAGENFLCFPTAKEFFSAAGENFFGGVILLLIDLLLRNIYQLSGDITLYDPLIFEFTGAFGTEKT